MDKLPTELLTEIIGHCDHALQKDLRLVCYAFFKAATPLVFEQVFLALFQEPLQNIGRIAHSNNLAKHVKKLTFFCDIMPDLGCIDVYASLIKQKMTFPDWLESEDREAGPGKWQTWKNRPGHSLSPREIEDGWEAYERLRLEQKNWTVATEGVVLADVLCRFPNLSHAVVTCETPSTRNESNQRPIWRRLREAVYVGPADWRYVRDRLEGSSEDMSVKAVLSLLEGLAARRQQSHLVGCATTTLHLTTVSQGSYQSICPQSHNRDILFDLDRLSGVFDFVEDLCIEIMESIYDQKTKTQILHELTSFLRRAQRLKKLRLQLNINYTSIYQISDSETVLPYPSLFDTETVLWPLIRSMSLRVDVPSNILLNFLALHAATIRELKLEYMVVRDVPLLLKRLPSILSLDKVYICKIFQVGVRIPDTTSDVVAYLPGMSGSGMAESYEKAMKAWLLGQSQIMPSLDQDGLGHRTHQR